MNLEQNRVDDATSKGKTIKVRGQAKKSAGWMPWHEEPMKDVISCEKLRGGANIHRSGDIRMGKPGWLNSHHYMNP